MIGCYVGSLQEPGCVLVRLYGRMTELYVNRDREVEMFQVFHAHGCGPQIYCSFQNGICYEFVRGTVLDDELLRQPSIYRSLPEELLHLYLFYLFISCGDHVCVSRTDLLLYMITIDQFGYKRGKRRLMTRSGLDHALCNIIYRNQAGRNLKQNLAHGG